MSKEQGKSRKPLIIGIVAAVIILAALLGLLLTQCAPGKKGEGETTTVPATTQPQAQTPEISDYDLYWNVDRALYDGKSEAGMSSRTPGEDGLFHVRFFYDGEIIELRVADRKTVNAIEVNDVMGLIFDDEGIVIGVTSIDDMPLEQVGWQFYVQSVGGKLLKLNSSKAFNGLEVLLDIHEFTGIWDMTGKEGEVGMSITPIGGDRVIAIANLAGQLTHVYVYDRPEFMESFEGYCQHCEKTVQWKKWTKETTLPVTEGHYQLQNNISGMTVQQAIQEDQQVCLDLNGMTVDGKNNARVYTLHNAGAHLAIMDNSEEQKGVLRGHSTSSDQGGVVWVRYGQFHLYSGTLDASDMVSKLNGTAVEVPKGSFFYMYGGRIIGGTAKWQRNEKGNYTNGIGGAVSVRGKFVMHDGIIEGGKALGTVTKYNADGTPNTYQRGTAGNVFVQSGGVFEMNGGTIKNGTATIAGGNVYVDGTGEFTMNGGTITGGRVTGKGRNGGNVYVTGKSTFTMNGGSIVNGSTYNCGANLYMNGTVIMNGGYIGGGKIYDWTTKKQNLTDARRNVFSVQGDFYMYGGQIDGGFYAIDTAVDKNATIVYLSGYATIVAPEGAKYSSLELSASGDGVTVRVGKLLDGAKIGVVTSTGIFTKPTAEHNVDNFFSEMDDAEICYVDGCIGLGRFSCLCGNNDKGDHYGECKGEQLFWGPLTSTAMPTVSGNYYLPRIADENGKLVPRTIKCKEQSSMVENAFIRLDLNGGTLIAKENYRFFSLHNPGAHLVITDSSEGKTGVAKSHGEGTTQGNVVWVRYGQFDFYGGTLDGSDYQLYKSWEAGTDGIFGTADDKESERKGGTVAMSTNTVFNMYGGTIIGNRMEGAEVTKTNTETVEVDGKEETVKTEVKRTVGTSGGGSLYIGVGCTFNMYAGEIKDGYSTDRGGNILIDTNAKSTNKKATFTMYGGTISGGETAQYGGNIAIADNATVIIAGGTITGGTSVKNGGNIWTSGGSSLLKMTSGLITEGETTSDQGGNIFCSGQMELLGGTVSNGKTNTSKNGGNIALNTGKDVLLQGVTVSGGTAKTGGNIGISTTNKGGSLIIAEGTVITGGNATNGGNLYISPNNYNKNDPNAVVVMTGGIMEKGTATGEGGNVYVAASGAGESSFTITGGTITGGTAKTGGNLRCAANTQIVVDGENALIEKGVTNNSGHGANVNVSGTITLKAGTIRDGVAANTAGNIYASGTGKIIIEGGNILGGTDKNGANATESSIYVVSAKLELRGGYMDGGVQIINYNNDNGSLKMSGAPVIKSETRKGLTLSMGNGTGGTATHIPYVEIDQPLTEGAEIYLHCGTASVGKFTTATEESYGKYFHPNDSTRSIGYVDSCLALGKTHCVCGSTTETHKPGCDGKQLFWMPWSSSSSLPTAAGNWYLTQDVKTGGQFAMTPDSLVRIDLNGKTVKDTSSRLISTAKANSSGNVELWITDTSAEQTGTLMLDYTAAYNGQGAIARICDGSDLVLIAGTLDASKAANTHGSGGVAIIVEGGSTFKMYGGTIIGAASATAGGSVSVVGSGIMDMYGGTIQGGHAGNGGNLFATGTATVNIHGGTITGGTATNGGNICVAGDATLTVNDGLITEGKAASIGGNIYMLDTANVNLLGGNVTEGRAGKDYVTDATGNGWGGNIEVAGTSYLLMAEGATVSGGRTIGNGGNIRIGADATMEMTGGTVSGGYNKDNGGNIFVQGVLTTTGGTIKDGTAKTGGNISFNSGKESTLNGLTITGGEATSQGGNVRIFNNATTIVNIGGNTHISGGIVPAAQAASANLNVTTAVTVNLSDCQIDGYAKFDSASATVTLTGKVMITGGETNLTLTNTKLTIKELSADARIGITANSTSGVFTNDTEEKYISNFFSDDPNLTVDFVEGRMVLSLGRYYCLCGSTNGTHALGCDGTVHFWSPWNSSTSLPNETGYWYLTKDVALSGQAKIESAQNIVLDLNGKTVKNAEGKNLRFYWLAHAEAQLTITDTVGGGNMTNNGSYTQGMIVWVGTAGSKVTLINGTLDISAATASNTYHSAPNAIELNAAGCTLTMYGGTIKGGKSNCGGGSVCAQNWDAIFYMYGGTIIGHAEDTYATVRLFGRNNLIAGGTITGGVELNSTPFTTDAIPGGAYLTLKGAPAIDSIFLTDDTATRGGPGDFLKLPLLKIEGKLENTTPIQLSVVGDADHVFTQTAVDAANASKFVPANAAQAILVIEDGDNAGKLYIGNARCLCGATDGNHKSYTDANGVTVGCDGKLKPFMAWTSTNSLPTTSGYWYLTSDVEFETQASMVENAKIVLDLNGHTVKPALKDGKYTNTRVYALFNLNNHLTITDTVGGGKIVGSPTYGSNGGVIWVRYNTSEEYTPVFQPENVGTFVLMGGTIEGNNPNYTGNGAVVMVDKYGSFYMLGGTVTGGTTTGWGGNVMIDDYAEMYMVDGTISDGQAGKGAGNVLIDPYATFVMEGGTITGGTVDNADGGNLYIYTNASGIINGGTISNGKAFRSGTAGSNGGNIKSEGSLQILGGTISDGIAFKILADGSLDENKANKAGWGGNIYSTGSLVIKNATITGGLAGGNGGSIYATKGLTMEKTTVTGGESRFNNGGNIFVSGGTAINITDCEITGGKADTGGNFTANSSAIITITGTTISGGGAVGAGGNVRVFNNAAATLILGEGTVVTGGTASSANAANANLNVTVAATVKLEGCKIDGYAQINNNAAVTVSGKTVITGGNMNLSYGGLMTVGTLTSGAKIGLNRDAGVFTANTVDAAYASYFTADKSGTDVAYVGEGSDKGKLAIGKVYAECGKTEEHDAHDYCDGKLHTWVGIDALPGATGYYYLTKQLDITSSSHSKTITTEQDIHLDLNGNDIVSKITGNNAGRLYSTRNADNWNVPVSILFTNTSSAAAAIKVDDAAVDGTTVGDEGRVIWIVGGNKKVAVHNVDIDMSGVEIRGGNKKNGVVFTTSNVGEADAAKRSSIILSDVNITGGNANGGLIYVGGNADVLLNNTVITGHTGSADFGGLFVTSSDANKPNTLTLAGNTRLYSNAKKDASSSNLYVGGFSTLKLAESYVGSTTAPQGIASVVGTVLLTEVGGEWFTADSATQKVVYMEDGMKIVSADAAIYCVCGSTNAVHQTGCDGTDFEWTALTSMDDLKTPGNYYLDKDFDAPNQIAFTAGETRVNLNGHTITDSSNRLFTTNGATNAKVTFTDTTADKKGALIVAYADGVSYSGQGAGFWLVGAGSELNWVNGTMDCSKVTNYQYGATAIYVGGGATFNMYNGTIKGGTFEKTAKTEKDGFGGAVRVIANGTMNMYGGTIEGGTVKGSHGGSLSVEGTLNLYNGTIQGGKAESITLNDTVIEVYGGNIYLTGTMNMYGGTVTGGAAYRGGNIAIQGGTLNFVDGTITSGAVTAISTEVKKHLGGNILLNGTLNMSGGTITNGLHDGATGQVASNIAIAGSGKLNMTGGTITGRISPFETRVENVVNLSGKISTIGGNALTISWSLPVYIGDLEEGSAIRIRVTENKTKYLYALDGHTLGEDDLKCFTAFYYLNSKSTEGVVSLDTENNRIVISPAS